MGRTSKKREKGKGEEEKEEIYTLVLDG